MAIQYVATSCFINAPIAYENPGTFGTPDTRNLGYAYVPFSTTGGASLLTQPTSATGGPTPGTDSQMWFNYRVPKQGQFFAPTFYPENHGFTNSTVPPMLGHKWRGQDLDTVGVSHPVFRSDTVNDWFPHMPPIAGVALAPFYACANMLNNRFSTYVNGVYGNKDRVSGFLIGSAPRARFDYVISRPHTPDTNYSALSRNPACPITYNAKDPSLVTNPQNTPILGPNAYSYFLENPTGPTFNNNKTDPIPGWGAPFRSGTVDVQNHNGPYSWPQFGNGPQQVQYRLVSAELALKYTGTEEDRGGLVTILEHPEHQSLVGYTLAQLQAYDACRTEAVMANKWHSCFYSGPINDTETEFSSVPLVTPFMAVVVSGGTNLSFQVEGWANYEFTGDAVRNKIMVCADEQGGVAVSTACKVLQATKRFGHGSGKAVLREAQRQINAGSGVS